MDNDYRGTVPNTFTPSAFAIHFSKDFLLANNRASPIGPSGKTWRFLVMTGRGAGDVVRDNIVEKIGPRDGDTIADANSAEIILSEAYHLRLEGRPWGISSEGYVLHPPSPGIPRAGGRRRGDPLRPAGRHLPTHRAADRRHRPT